MPFSARPLAVRRSTRGCSADRYHLRIGQVGRWESRGAVQPETDFHCKRPLWPAGLLPPARYFEAAAFQHGYCHSREIPIGTVRDLDALGDSLAVDAEFDVDHPLFSKPPLTVGVIVFHS